jgi:hypothetical protein
VIGNFVLAVIEIAAVAIVLPVVAAWLIGL